MYYVFSAAVAEILEIFQMVQVRRKLIQAVIIFINIYFPM